jgi:hypothetical protein
MNDSRDKAYYKQSGHRLYSSTNGHTTRPLISALKAPWSHTVGRSLDRGQGMGSDQRQVLIQQFE